ncbi:MAG: adenylate kinase [Elusimicrobia bacterium]|nr:adenylate kinase [Elusimicrobiota bacterium]
MSAANLRIVLLGCPGAGKGTQASALCGRYGLAHVATGDLFRAEVAAKTALGLKVSDYMKRGVLVPDETVNEMVAGKLGSLSGGWLLDGFPRTLSQAQELDKAMKAGGGRIDLILNLRMPPEEVVRRMAGRRSCPACGEVYNIESRPPKIEGKCDKCAGPLLQREDDKDATVRKRLMVYEDLTRPLAAYYRSEGAFEEVDGSLPADEVTQGAARIIDRLLAGRSGFSAG